MSEPAVLVYLVWTPAGWAIDPACMDGEPLDVPEGSSQTEMALHTPPTAIKLARLILDASGASEACTSYRKYLT